MNTRTNRQQVMAFLLGLLLVGAVGFAVLNIVRPLSFEWPFGLVSAGTRAAGAFDYERAADISAMRWYEMAKFYEKHGMLTYNSLDYDKAADISAMRWRAMAQFYKDHDILTRDDFDYEKAVDIMAMRWYEMAKFYEKHSTLSER